MTVEFRCGHTLDLPRNVAAAPVCPCGERIVSRVSGAVPRFVGTCSGPYAETQALEPAMVDVAPAGPLRLKPPKE
jgi:hypothetical protein